MARQITGGVCEAVKPVKFSVWCGAVAVWRCAGVVFLYHLCPCSTDVRNCARDPSVRRSMIYKWPSVAANTVNLREGKRDPDVTLTPTRVCGVRAVNQFCAGRRHHPSIKVAFQHTSSFTLIDDHDLIALLCRYVCCDASSCELRFERLYAYDTHAIAQSVF